MCLYRYMPECAYGGESATNRLGSSHLFLKGHGFLDEISKGTDSLLGVVGSGVKREHQEVAMQHEGREPFFPRTALFAGASREFCTRC